MRKFLYHLFILVGLFFSSLSHAQIVLEALEGGIPFTPSAKCLELVYDRNYGDGDHNFIYCAIIGNDGRKWLNLNLGAEYAKESSPYFDPAQQAISHDDWKAYGSLFQWQRPADGHELMHWDDGYGGYAINGYTNSLWNNTNWAPNHKQVLIGGSDSNSWSWVTEPVNTNINYHNLWQSGGTNNPCPKNYHPPTRQEWFEYFDLSLGHAADPGYDHWSYIDPLKLPTAGYGNYDQHLPGAMLFGFYWSSESRSDAETSYVLYFSNNTTDEGAVSVRMYGLPVRCISDDPWIAPNP